MQYIQSPVSTLCLGQAASMASLLLTAGQPGERRSLPHTRIMMHQPSGGFQVLPRSALDELPNRQAQQTVTEAACAGTS